MIPSYVVAPPERKKKGTSPRKFSMASTSPCNSLRAWKSGFHSIATSSTIISLKIHKIPNEAPITYTVT